MITNKALYNFIQQQATYCIARYKHVNFIYYNRTEIKNDLARHIFLKKHLINFKRGYKTYIRTIIQRQLKNIIRDHYSKLKLRPESPFETKLINSYFGSYYEIAPDIEDPTNIIDIIGVNEINWAAFRNSLRTNDYKIVWDYLLNNKPLSKELQSNTRRVDFIKCALKKKFKKFIYV